MRLWLVVLALALVACETERHAPFLDVATTTSVVNSGLLATLLPQFTSATVRVNAAGSGRSLTMLADHQVAAVITHAPQAEARYLADHPGWRYRKLASNRFVIVGPKDDPAGIRSAASAADAFHRIAQAKAPFISRGDQSGTHEREQELWKAAGVTAPDVLISGAGMAMALRHANERNAYTLADEATWWQLEQDLELSVLFAGDAALLNTYAVIARADEPSAVAFADWLSDGEGRGLIAGYKIAGKPAFAVWPSGCPRETPAALPCP